MSTAKVSLDVLIFVLLAEMRKQDKEVSQDGKQKHRIISQKSWLSSEVILHRELCVTNRRIIMKMIWQMYFPS